MKRTLIALVFAVSLPANADKALDKEIKRTDAQMLKILKQACDKGSFEHCMMYRAMLEEAKAKGAPKKVQQPCPPVEVEPVEIVAPPRKD